MRIRLFFTSIICALLFSQSSCEKDDLEFQVDKLTKTTFYSSEIIPVKFLEVYGKWKLTDVSGGIKGQGNEPNFEILEIKNYGIYGIFKNNSLIEYGKIGFGKNKFDNTKMLTLNFIPLFVQGGSNSNIFPTEKNIHIQHTDTLNLFSPCCDMFNYHFARLD